MHLQSNDKTEACEGERPGHSDVTVEQLAVDPTISRMQLQRPNHYIMMSHVILQSNHIPPRSSFLQPTDKAYEYNEYDNQYKWNDHTDSNNNAGKHTHTHYNYTT